MVSKKPEMQASAIDVKEIIRAVTALQHYTQSFKQQLKTLYLTSISVTEIKYDKQYSLTIVFSSHKQLTAEPLMLPNTRMIMCM